MDKASGNSQSLSFLTLILPPLPQILALILAAVVHDVGHDGLNNAFHQAALTDRAVSFNDQSIQVLAAAPSSVIAALFQTRAVP